MPSLRPSLRSVTGSVMVIAVAVTAALAYVLYLGAQQRSETNARVTVQVAQIARYEDAQVSFANLGSNLATYYAIRGPTYIDAFELARSQVDVSLAAAVAAAPQLGDAETVRAKALAESFASVGAAQERVLRAVEQDDIAKALAITAETGLLEGPGLTLDIQQLIGDERNTLAADQRADSAAQQRTFEYSLAIAGTWALLLLLLGLASMRGLVRPLEKMSLATLAIAGGDVAARVAETGPRELARVGADINQMTEALIRRSDELSAYLSRNLEARTAELEGANSALNASEQRFRGVVQNAADMITIVDSAGKAIYASPSFERTMGYGSDDWHEINVLELIHPDDLTRALASLARVAAVPGAHPAIELRLRRLDGSYRDLEMVGTNLLDDPAVGGIVHNSRDVTGRREMESALRESEARFRSIAQHSPVGIYQLTLDRRVLYMNPAALAIFGSPDLASLQERPFTSFFTAQSLEAMRPEHAKRAEGQGSTYEVEAIRIDGTHRDLLVSGAALIDVTGAAQSVVGTIMDVTERKRAQDALGESEEKFRLLFASNPYPMWVYDLETLAFLEVNDAAVTNYGFTRDQFLTMRITDIRPQEDNQKLLVIPKRDSPLQKSGEWRHCTADGRLIEVEITSHSFRFESREAVLVVAMDITERKRVQQALVESEERFRSLVQNASDLITVVRADTTVVYQSPSIDGTLGLKAPDVIGRKFSDLVHPNDRAVLVAFLLQATARRGGAAVCEARLRHQDGSWRACELIGTDRTADLAVRGFVLNTRDVSERRTLEQQLREQAFQDALTGLANRARFTERLDHALERRDDGTRHVGVLFLDLDNFKSINDSLGVSSLK